MWYEVYENGDGVAVCGVSAGFPFSVFHIGCEAFLSISRLKLYFCWMFMWLLVLERLSNLLFLGEKPAWGCLHACCTCQLLFRPWDQLRYWDPYKWPSVKFGRWFRVVFANTRHICRTYCASYPSVLWSATGRLSALSKNGCGSYTFGMWNFYLFCCTGYLRQ
jgi:hypothetical protein